MNDDLAFALALADEADVITLAYFRSAELHIETKPDLTPVTEADRAVETRIRTLVVESGRGEDVLGEEEGGGVGPATWIVDPIDGTKSYLRGVPAWATLLALTREGELDVSVVSAPALRRRWWAVRGGGAFADGERCHVSGVERIEDAVVCTTAARDMPAGWRTLSRRAWAERGFGDFWQHCLVAEGAVELATDPTLQLWDYAALQLLVAEAGGHCSTFAGNEPSPGDSFLTSNGRVHATAVSLLGA